MMGYLAAIVAGSVDLLAGWLTLRGRMAHLEPRYVIAFTAGVLLSVTFFHVLPDVTWATDTPWLALGFVTFYVLEKLTMIHACGEEECATHQVGPIAVVGMATDNVTDGAAIMAGYHLSSWLGASITLAVILHEIPQGMASALIMRNARWSVPRMVWALALAGSLYPIGALIAGLIPAGFQQKILAFVAGDFIYLGAADLLPEAHRRFNWKVILLVLVGMACLYALKWLEQFHGLLA